MSVKLLNEHHFELEATQARLSLHLSKCHIVGNHMSGLKLSWINPVTSMYFHVEWKAIWILISWLLRSHMIWTYTVFKMGYMYSKTYVKWPLENRQKIDLNDKW